MKAVSGFCFAILAMVVSAQQGPWDQCGGQNWSGSTSCVSGWTCTYQNPWYSQCLQSASTTLTTVTTTQASSTSTPVPSPTAPPTPPKAPTGVRFAGVNIAGFDFGCGIDGSCVLADVTPAPNAAGQMSHFYNDDNLNIFRLPVGWQYLVNNQLGGSLDPNNIAAYDNLVQSCLSTGAHCIIDIHNYARWNGGIIGQGGPSNAQFASLWSQLASKYANQNKVIFGIMNEPHDIPSMSAWAQTVQTVVTAIRGAGANSQYILLPGNDWTSAAAYVPNGSLQALKAVVNPDGSTTRLIFDVHQYLDSDSSGQSTECVTNNINNAFAPLASALRAINRQALLSETGGGNTVSCRQYLCQQLEYLNQNSDVYLGFTTWAAGGFQTTYNLSEVPTQNGNSWVDTSLVSACIAR